ncbi:MAG: glycosyltransferase [Syntrophales bacterium]|nr:glycosyltransferase [Syntrophales bacterium]
MTNKKGIILYDFFAVAGGAERVILLLAEALDHVDLCLGYRDAKGITDREMDGIKCYELSKKCDIPPLRTIKLMRAFVSKTEFLSGYEWALFSGAIAPLAVANHQEGRNLLYCHTIPRFAYDLKDYYMNLLPGWQRPLLKALIEYTRPRYEAAVSKMDTIIVNSENVRKRLKTYLGVDSQVICPPCETGKFQWLGEGGYYLSTARLENFKRVELIIRAFIRMPDKKLVVTSGGSELNRLKRLAQDSHNITFTGWTSEEELLKLVGNAIATVYIPIDEDFGMSPVESMAAGKPVIGVREGGLLETVIHGETGLLISSNPSEEDIIEAVQKMGTETARAMKDACETRARLFDKGIFLEKIYAVLQ